MSVPTKILVVDDEPDLAVLVRQKFRKQIREGVYSFVIAADGVEALEHLEREPDIEIILTDINMPRMDGLTLLNRISAFDRILQAVVVSAYGDLDNIRAAMNRGSFDFLMKPIDLIDLEITLNKAKETVLKQRKAAEVRKTFGRYLSDDVVATLLSNPDALELGGEKRKVSILMSDLRGFSNISENLAPEQVVEVLNTYLGKMADIISRYMGTIDEFIGDAILAIFGAPFLRDDDAMRAVACATEMQCAMTGVNEELARRGLPSLEMGIGINTGEVVVGNIGSQTRTKYGVVGSHVNLTSRIESYSVGSQILISDSTYNEVKHIVHIGKQMKLSAKGFSEPFSIYEIEGVGGEYNLEVPKKSYNTFALTEPLPVKFFILDGKHMTGSLYEGTIISLSPSMAKLKATTPLELLSNLKLEFVTSTTKEAQITGDLYAKTIEISNAPDVYLIRFTALPEDVAEEIRRLSANLEQTLD